MIGLDTNLMIRYLIQDHPQQSKIANHTVEKLIHAGETIWICQITLCEIFWVLESCYKLNKKELISIFTTLLQTRQIVVERDDIAWKALCDYELHNKIGFVDCLIARQNLSHDCRYTLTFDKKAAKLKHLFKLAS